MGEGDPVDRLLDLWFGIFVVDPQRRGPCSCWRDLDPHWRDLDPHWRDLDPHWRDPDPHWRDPDPHWRDPDPHWRDLDPHWRDLDPHWRDLDPRWRDLDPHRTSDGFTLLHFWGGGKAFFLPVHGKGNPVFSAAFDFIH